VASTPYTNPMINDPPCSISNHEWREEGAHGFRTASEPRKTPPKINLDSKTARTNVPPLMRLEEMARRRQGPNKLRAGADQNASTVSYIAPRSPSLGLWQPPPAMPLAPVSNCCISLTPDSLDGVFKKITMPCRRCRLFRRPGLGFPPEIKVG
jgi:hypothetical protein